MLTLTILAALLIIVSVIAIGAALVGGVGFILTFGDVILAGLVIVWILKKIIKKK